MSRRERATVSAATESTWPSPTGSDTVITEQSLPQHPGPPWPLYTMTRSLDDIVTGIREIHDHTVQAAATVRADADEKIHTLKVTAARLAAERDNARRENRALIAAAFVLVADSIRREENLQECLQDALDKAGRNSRQGAERIALLTGDNEQLRTENTALQTAVATAGPRHRFRRANRP